MPWLKQNWARRIIKTSTVVFCMALLVVIALGIADTADAHRSGCHRWHSCPSDSGSYICGDAGYPCQYPTYPASGGVIHPPSGYYRDCYNCPLKKVPANATVSGYTLTCNWGYYKYNGSCVKLVVPENAIIAAAGHSWNCNSGYKEVGNLCIKIMLDLSDNIQTKIKTNQAAYYKNPHWFREKLIQDLVEEFGSQYSYVIGRLVYTLFPDVKN